MRRSKKQIVEAAEDFVVQLLEQYPEAEADIAFESVGGGDVWIEIELPSQMGNLRPEVVDTAIDLSFKYSDDRGVNIVFTVEVKEPVPNG